MSARRVNSAVLPAVLEAIDEDRLPEPAELRDAVRTLLALLAAKAPGRSVEMRVPPFGAVQCAEGPGHTRGTPPNVVETDPVTFIRLATGRLSWAAAVESGALTASGSRADLSAQLPCWPVAR